jgi:hypothetical protein
MIGLTILLLSVIGCALIDRNLTVVTLAIIGFLAAISGLSCTDTVFRAGAICLMK